MIKLSGERGKLNSGRTMPCRGTFFSSFSTLSVSLALRSMSSQTTTAN